jgi:murein DD-endopeptidase MepM/ murein hydrolase activator NlpD
VNQRFIWIGVGMLAVLLAAVLFLSPRGRSSVPFMEPHVVVSTGTVAANSTLSAALRQEGLTENQIFRLSQSLRPVVRIRSIPAGAAYEVHHSSTGALVLFRYWTSRSEYADLRPDPAGGFSLQKGEVALRSKVMGVQGTIQSSLWEAMREQDIAPELIYRFAEVFAWEIDFLTETQKGDTFRLVWQRRANDTLEMEGMILIAEYNGRNTGRRTAVRFGNDYYDLEGKSLQRQFLRAPLTFRRISSGFSRRRFQPVLRIYRPHHGIDYAAAHGTPVVSIGSGVVTHRGWHGGHGNTVKVRHSGAYASLYGHLSRYAAGVYPGKRVRQGELIGYVGSTGVSTGPHLHFEFTVNGRPVNFFGMKLPAAGGIGKDQAGAYADTRREYLTYLSLAANASGEPTLIKDPN